ncbi:hypothetical protein ACN28S_28615 [Cystobacter fuscus]
MRPQRPSFWLALVGLSLGGPALAGEPVRTLYVKAKNTHLKDSGSPTADTLRVLQPGHPVSYLGREGTSSWHRVSVAVDKGALEGFIYQANLSASPPRWKSSARIRRSPCPPRPSPPRARPSRRSVPAPSSSARRWSTPRASSSSSTCRSWPARCGRPTWPRTPARPGCPRWWARAR